MNEPLGAAFAHARWPVSAFTPRREGLSTVYLICPWVSAISRSREEAEASAVRSSIVVVVMVVDTIRRQDVQENHTNGRSLPCALLLPKCWRTVNATRNHCKGSDNELRSGSWLFPLVCDQYKGAGARSGVLVWRLCNWSRRVSQGLPSAPESYRIAGRVVMRAKTTRLWHL